MSNGYNIASDCVDKHPADLPALVCVDWDPAAQEIKSRLFSFGELQKLTNRLARGLLALGLLRGDRILLQLPNGFEFPVAFIGAIKAGVIPIPASPLLTKSELDFLMKDSDASFVVCNSPPPPLKLRGGRGSYVFWNDLLSESSEQFQIHPTHSDDPAYWLYTSGTEGRPKGVLHAHRSIPAHDSRVKSWLDLKRGDVVFNTSSLNWSYALTCGLLDVWRHGAPTVIYNGPLQPEILCQVIDEQKVSVFMSVPGVYRRLANYLPPPAPPFKGEEAHEFPLLCKEGSGEVENLRVCLSAGEKLPEEIRERFRDATGITIREGLGMTEHSVYLVQSVGDPVVAGSCGKPVPGTRISILRDDLTDCAPGETGVISSHRSCEGLMLGYHGSPLPLGRRRGEPVEPGKGEGGSFSGDWFLSDDLAYRDEAGNFFFVGRRDDVITVGGYRISPMEVEAVLNQHPAIEESAVVGREIEAGKTIVCAFVVCRSGVPPPEKGELIAHASRHLARYKVPRDVVFVEQLPKTGSGKIKRREFQGWFTQKLSSE